MNRTLSKILYVDDYQLPKKGRKRILRKILDNIRTYTFFKEKTSQFTTVLFTIMSSNYGSIIFAIILYLTKVSYLSFRRFTSCFISKTMQIQNQMCVTKLFRLPEYVLYLQTRWTENVIFIISNNFELFKAKIRM